jgi:hypothetical protein
MRLDQPTQQYIAQRAHWYIDVYPPGYPYATDNFVLTGEGVEDLDQTIARVEAYGTVRPARLVCEVGTTGTVLLGNAFPKYLTCDVDDLRAIRTYYIEWYGTVNRPDVYATGTGAAMETPCQPQDVCIWCTTGSLTGTYFGSTWPG